MIESDIEIKFKRERERVQERVQEREREFKRALKREREREFKRERERGQTRSVVPVPGGPTRRAPLGILAPSSVYFEGFFKKSTNSRISALASSKPETSLKRVSLFVFVVVIFSPRLNIFFGAISLSDERKKKKGAIKRAVKSRNLATSVFLFCFVTIRSMATRLMDGWMD